MCIYIITVKRGKGDIVQALCESRGGRPGAVRPNEPSGFRGRKELLNRASALVTTADLSLICQMTSEDIKHQLIIRKGGKGDSPGALSPVTTLIVVCKLLGSGR